MAKSGRDYVTKFGADNSGFVKGVDEMMSKVRDLNKSLTENKKAQKEASKEISDAEKELKKLDKEIAKSGEATEEQKKKREQLNAVIKDGKDKLDALRVVEGQLRKEITDTNDSIGKQKKAYEQLTSSIEGAKASGSDLAKEIGVIGAAAVASTAAIVKFVGDAAAWADSMNTMRDVTGISTQDLQKFAYASELVDVSMETMTGSLTKLTRNMQGALNNSSGTAAQAFKALDVQIEDGTGHLRDRQQVFYEVIDALGKVSNETERDALSMNIFGRSAEQLNPLIKGGAETLKALGDEAERAGLILDQKTLDSLHGFNDEIDKIKSKGGQIAKIVGAEALPAVEGLTEAADDLLNEVKQMADSGELSAMAKSAGQLIKQGVTDLKNLVSWVLKHKEAVAGAAGAMVGFKVGMSIGGLINSLMAGFSALKVITDKETASQLALNTAMNTNPIGAVIGLVGALVGGITALTAAQNAASDAIDKTNEALDSANSAYASAAAQAEGEAGMLEALGKKYDELRSKSKLTGEEKTQLKNISEQLREKLGLTAAQVQDEAGKFQDLTKYIDEATEALKRQAQAQAAQAGLTEAIKKQNEAELAVQQAIARAREKYPGLYDEEGGLVPGQWTYENSDAVKEVNELIKAHSEASKAVEFYAGKVEEAATAEGKLSDKSKETAEVLGSTSSGAAYATEEIEEYSKKLLEGEGSLEEFYSMFDNMDEAVEFFSDKLTEANKALEDNKDKLSQARQEKNKYLKELGEGSEDYVKAKNRVSELETEQTKLRIAVKNARADYEAATQAAKTLSEKLSDISKESATLRSALSSLSDVYKQLNEGQVLSLDTLLSLSEKYPEYTAALINATGNAEKQKEVIGLLFEVKKQELILTLQKARDEIAADNQCTDAIIENAKKRLACIEAEAAAGANWAKTNIGYIQQLRAEIEKLTETRARVLAPYDTAIDNLRNVSINNYKPGAGVSYSSGSGSSGSGGSSKVTYTTTGGGEVGTGDSRISSKLAWADRMVAMGKMTESQLKAWYERILRTEQMTADESYNIRLRLKNLTDKLNNAEVKAKEEAEKKKQDAEKKTAEERKKQIEYAKAAYERLVKGQIEAYQKSNEEYNKYYNEQIKRIEDAEKKRTQAAEDKKRSDEISSIDRELRVRSNQLTESEKISLKLRKQNLLDAQAEADHQRAVEKKKLDLQTQNNTWISKNTQAISRLNATLEKATYLLDKKSGNASATQIVNNTNVNGVTAYLKKALTDAEYKQLIRLIY